MCGHSWPGKAFYETVNIALDKRRPNAAPDALKSIRRDEKAVIGRILLGTSNTAYGIRISLMVEYMGYQAFAP